MAGSKPKKNSKPVFTEDDAQTIAWEQFGLKGVASKLDGERDLNFRIEVGIESHVLKLSHPDNSLGQLELQNRAMSLCHAVQTLNCPYPLKNRERQSVVAKQVASGDVWQIRCLTYVDGTPLGKVPVDDPRRNDSLWRSIGHGVAYLDMALAPLSRQGKSGNYKWDLASAREIVRESKLLTEVGGQDRAGTLKECLRHFEAIESRLEKLPSSVIHGDVNDYNIIILNRESGAQPINVGFIDFGDVVFSKTIYNLAICLAYSILDMPRPMDVAASIVKAYNDIRPLSESELSVLFPMLLMRLAQSVCISSVQRETDPENDYLNITSRPAWAMLERISGLDPHEVCDQFSQACRKNSNASKAVFVGEGSKLMLRRKKKLSPSLSLAYDRPLHIVRGSAQYLYDSNDVTYLDCVNNVCHVGHCHPQVVAAATNQIGVLNTNSRYLHENIVRLAEKLTSTLDPSLEVCFFVNSGSEANDLALRLARNFTGRHDMCVIDHAYHGHVTSLIEISPYKFNSRGGKGKPESTHVLPMPDTFRGKFKAGDPNCVASYVEEADKVISVAEKSARGLAGLIAEPILSCGGQVPLPPGYLAQVYDKIRSLGGVCISDEVQVGFGRVGTHYWGYQQHEVVPDIVTMGKPFGNGHPLAAVVTTREIADAFNNGMEYFNTFGGNPVSCAIGLAVMDVIDSSELQANAFETGQWLLEQFGELKKQFSVVGDVRGSGYFLGIEFVEDRKSSKPAPETASAVVQQMRDKCILLSTDGPLENVIKFKPPMVFSKADAERLVWNLEKVIGSACAMR